MTAPAGTTRRRTTIIVAVGLFGAIFAARWLSAGPGTGLGFLYVLPIAILGMEFGIAGGLAAAAMSFALFCVWAAVGGGASIGVIGYLTRGVMFPGAGWLVGRLETQRRVLEDQSKHWFETSNAMLGEANFDGYFTRVSSAWERVLGFRAQEITSKPFIEFVHPDDVEATMAAASALVAAPTALVNFENRYLTKSGTWRCIRWNASSDKNHIYAVGSDVTDLKAIQAERSELLAKVELIARTDELTGLPNRRAWEEELRREMSRAARNGQPLYLLMLDLDHFKQYNDAHGHQAGDGLLQQAATSWRAAIRDSDFIARYGGEEFAVLLPDAEPNEGVAGIVERLRDSVPAGQTCSAGLVLWDKSEPPAQLVARADAALYNAKRAGRNRVITTV